MKRPILSILLAASSLIGAHAQTITASPESLTFPPMQSPGRSEPMTVTLINHSDQDVQIIGEIFPPLLGFQAYLPSCITTIPPGATCTISVEFTPYSEVPLGPHSEILTVETTTNTLNIPLHGFSFNPTFGVEGISETVKDLQSQGVFVGGLRERLKNAEWFVLDGNASNNAAVCGQLKAFVHLTEHYVATGQMIDFLGIGLVAQAERVSGYLACK